MANISLKRRVTNREPVSFVVIGGGSGSFSILSGLKANRRVRLSAICSMMDSGGHSGALRDAYGVLPPGDLRRCLVALSEESELLRDLFSYRMEEAPYSGTNIGNLMIVALTRLLGNEERAIEGVAKILNIRGDVIPVTLASTHLNAVLSNGEVVHGEANIDLRSTRLANPMLPMITSVFLEPAVDANEKALSAIAEADCIIVAPGDIYTSIVPNLLVDGIADALVRSSAPMLYVLNLMTKHGETDGWSAVKHVETVSKYATRVPEVVIAHRGEVPAELMSSYRHEHASPIAVDVTSLRSLGVHDVLQADIMSSTSVVRHDPDKAARVIVDAYNSLRQPHEQVLQEVG